MSTCTCCQQGHLFPSHLHNGPFAYTCNSCHGFAIDISTYVDWRQAQNANPHAGPHAPKGEVRPPPSTHRALQCPSCQRLMLKYRVHAGESPSVDVCLLCEAIWLDAGEWEYLQALGLHTSLTAITTPAWQTRRAQFDMLLRRNLEDKAQLGEEVYNQVEQVAQWLQTQPKRQHILKILNRLTQ